MKTTKILVAYDLSTSHRNYLKKIFDKIEVIVYDKKNLEPNIDLIYLTGGADVNPQLYGQRKGKNTSTNTSRDELEMEILNIYYSTPKLGICRGAQLLTVFSGAKLIQHVEGHNTDHSIQTSFNMADYHYKSFNMSSSHHQMMYPYHLPKNNYDLIAWSEYFLSNTYLNGYDKEIIKVEDFLEPEIVYYKDTKSLCIQGHPEYIHVPEETVEFTKKLILTYCNE